MTIGDRVSSGDSLEHLEDSGIHGLFEAQVARAPDAVAVQFGDYELSYAELNRRANRLASHLAGRGLEPEIIVGLDATRGPGLLVGMLGIWKAGGAYLPLDPHYPRERLRFIIEDARPSLLIQHSSGALRGIGSETPAIELDAAMGADASDDGQLLSCPPGRLAYLIYTSGSSGHPKGALLEHGGLRNVALEQARHFGVGPGDRILQFSPPNFDASVFEIVMALTTGATLVTAIPDQLLPGAPLSNFLRKRAVSIVTIPPSSLNVLPAAPLPALRTILVAGEPCPEQLVDRWAGGRRFFNLYGPTECTVWSTVAECRAGGGVPGIGHAIANTRLSVLDADGNPVQAGAAGELHIGGAGVGRGYLRRPAMTDEHFVPDPFDDTPGARLYRTGDLVKIRQEGDLEFVGRIDNQVKVRGFRIEPEEIEATIRSHPDVHDAAIVVCGDRPDDRRLVAFVAPASAADANIQRFVAATLPAYMVPR